ncbi:MAG TPA: hypothetical protein PK556_08830, partial [Smithellaceae bacterium]|nr:hypothetical protein [Smithellaceae bacterium]
GRKRPFLASKPLYGIPGLVVEFLAAFFSFFQEAYQNRGGTIEDQFYFSENQGFNTSHREFGCLPGTVDK